MEAAQTYHQRTNKQNLIYLSNGVSFRKEKARSPDTCTVIGKSWKPSAKGKKSDTSGYIWRFHFYKMSIRSPDTHMGIYKSWKPSAKGQKPDISGCIWWFHFYKMSRTGKSIEAKSRDQKANNCCYGLREVDGSNCLRSVWFSWTVRKIVWGLNVSIIAQCWECAIYHWVCIEKR